MTAITNPFEDPKNLEECKRLNYMLKKMAKVADIPPDFDEVLKFQRYGVGKKPVLPSYVEKFGMFWIIGVGVTFRRDEGAGDIENLEGGFYLAFATPESFPHLAEIWNARKAYGVKAAVEKGYDELEVRDIFRIEFSVNEFLKAMDSVVVNTGRNNYGNLYSLIKDWDVYDVYSPFEFMGWGPKRNPRIPGKFLIGKFSSYDGIREYALGGIFRTNSLGIMVECLFKTFDRFPSVPRKIIYDTIYDRENALSI